MKSATSEAFTSVRAYFTNLCASVATKINPSGENWKNTPLITGRKSSFPAAKIVLLIAVANTSAGTIVEDGLSKTTDFGNSSPGANAMAYFPEFELISIVLFSSTGNVNGCSGNVFRISNNNFAGTATLPLLVDSISKVADMVVSRSEAETVKAFLSNSNKKLSKIGS